MTDNAKKHLFDDPRNVKRVIYALYAACAVLAAADFFVGRHVDHPLEWFYQFYPVYGFVACVILVLVAKEARKLLMRKEDHYEDQ